MTESPLVLALDTGSPVVSVAIGALGRGGEVLAARSIEQTRSSATLLDQVSAVLSEVGARPADLGAVVALRGPGSFTGLRIGLSTALGLHQALGVRATALPTLRALAVWAAGEAGEGPVLAVVDALRGEWSAQLFSPEPFPRPLSAEELRPGAELAGFFEPSGAGRIAGFGVSRLAGESGSTLLLEPGPLAPAALRLAAEPELAWDPALLTSPLYARPPAVTFPKDRPGAGGRP